MRQCSIRGVLGHPEILILPLGQLWDGTHELDLACFVALMSDQLHVHLGNGFVTASVVMTVLGLLAIARHLP